MNLAVCNDLTVLELMVLVNIFIDKIKLLIHIILIVVSSVDVLKSFIVNDEKFLKIYKSELNFFREKIERDLAAEIDWYYKKHADASLADFLTYITKSDELNNMILEILSKNSDEELNEDNFLEYLKQMKKKIKDDDILALKQKARDEQDVSKKMKIIDEITKIKKGCVDNE